MIRQIRRQRLRRNTLWRRRNVTQSYHLEVVPILGIQRVVSRVPFKLKQNSKQLRAPHAAERGREVRAASTNVMRRHDSFNTPEPSMTDAAIISWKRTLRGQISAAKFNPVRVQTTTA
jgi:hypothetical protein